MAGSNPWSDGNALASHVDDLFRVDITDLRGLTWLQLPVPEGT